MPKASQGQCEEIERFARSFGKADCTYITTAAAYTLKIGGRTLLIRRETFDEGTWMTQIRDAFRFS